jgi:hypothetical protein
MEAQKVCLRHFAETVAPILSNIFIDPLRQKCSGRLPVETLTHDVANNLAQSRAVCEPERVRLAERLPHRDVLFRRPAMGPDKHILQ